MKYVDCHNHSIFSFDGDFTAEKMVEAAIDKGINTFAITDHCEINKYTEHKLSLKIPQSIKKINELKKVYENITLIAGIEMGQPLQSILHTQEFLKIEGLDFVLGSLHNIKDNDDFYWIDYSALSDGEILNLLKKYYEEIYAMVKWNQFDSLAHILYPYRYMVAKRAGREVGIDIAQFDDNIREIFKVIIANGKAIECNTSRSFCASDSVEPERMCRYLEMYKQLGGEMITIGSDSHDTTNIGNGIAKGYQILRDVGFKAVTYFVDRKPLFIDID